MSTPTIGILGGMGPRATVEFERRLVNAFDGKDQNIPTIITINSGSIPDRSNFLTASAEDPLTELTLQANKLLNIGVDIVCMPCNTAHSSKILARLMAITPLPILDMPAACLIKSEQLGFKKVLILGTKGTVCEGIFENRNVNCECVYPNNSEQQIISRLISKIKTNSPLTESDLRNFRAICARQNTNAIILACTELSLLPKNYLKNFNIIDSVDILIDSCKNFVRRLDDARRIHH